MSRSEKDDIEALLAEGLEHYGCDEIGLAILSWERVLEIDPDNAVARDYIESADRRKAPRALPLRTPERTVLDDARDCIAGGDFEEAFDFLESADGRLAAQLEFQAMRELVRSRLLSDYRKRVGSLASVPELRAHPATITKFNLPPDAGFVLSLVDGQLSLGDMISISGMDPFDAFRIVQGLLRAEIVSMRA